MLVQEPIKVNTRQRGITDITNQVNEIVKSSGIEIGICQLFCQHTSASLIISENYDSDVKLDIETFLHGLVKDGDPRFSHVMEGEDDMSAHIRTLLTETSLSLPVQKGHLGLGQWQGICLYEHRYNGHERNILLTCIGK